MVVFRNNMKKINLLESIEDEVYNSILAWEENDDEKTVKKIYLVNKVNELIKAVNKLNGIKK